MFRESNIHLVNSGELGLFFINSDSFGWRRVDGGKTVTHTTESVLHAVWLDGRLEIQCVGSELLVFVGFAHTHFEEFRCYFQLRGICLARSQTISEMSAEDFDNIMRRLARRADLVDEAASGSVSKKVREVDLMKTVESIRDGLERAIGGDKRLLNQVFAERGCERIGRLQLIVDTVGLEVYCDDPRWLHLKSLAASIEAILRDFQTFQPWQLPEDDGFVSSFRRQLLLRRSESVQAPHDLTTAAHQAGELLVADMAGFSPAAQSEQLPVEGPAEDAIEQAANFHHEVAKVVPVRTPDHPLRAAHPLAGLPRLVATPPLRQTCSSAHCSNEMSPPPLAAVARAASSSSIPVSTVRATATPAMLVRCDVDEDDSDDGEEEVSDHPGQMFTMWAEVEDGRCFVAGRLRCDSLREGWVWKRSKYFGRWRRRWFVLTPTCLSSYKARRPEAATEIFQKGSVYGVCETSLEGPSEKPGALSFCITASQHQCPATQLRRYYIACDSSPERKEWMRLIEKVLVLSRRASLEEDGLLWE